MCCCSTVCLPFLQSNISDACMWSFRRIWFLLFGIISFSGLSSSSEEILLSEIVLSFRTLFLFVWEGTFVLELDFSGVVSLLVLVVYTVLSVLCFCVVGFSGVLFHIPLRLVVVNFLITLIAELLCGWFSALSCLAIVLCSVYKFLGGYQRI